MNTATAAVQPNHTQVVRHALAPRAPAPRRADSAFSRSTTDGAFSLFEHGSISIDAEAGLVIRVHAGCLWVPHHEEHCSVGVGAGEQFTVQRTGRVTVLANRGTQVELQWPSRERPLNNLH